MQRQITLVGGYGGWTIGDHITLDTAISQLRMLTPRPCMSVVTPTAAECMTTLLHAAPDVQIVPFRVSARHGSRLSRFRALVKARGNPYRCQRILQETHIANTVSAWETGAINHDESSNPARCIKESDALYLVGGGYIHGMNGMHIAGHLLAVAEKHEVPVYSGPLGLMPMQDGPIAAHYKRLLGSARHISVRDNESRRWLERNQVAENRSSLDHDDAIWSFARWSKCVERDQQLFNSLCVWGKATIGVSWCPQFTEDENAEREAERRLARHLDDICANRDVAFLGIPMHLEPSTDTSSIARVFSYMQSGAPRRIAPALMNWREIAGLIGNLEMVISARFHLFMMALATGVPAVGVFSSPYYETKMQSVAETFRVPEAVASLNSDEPLARKVNVILEMPSLKTSLTSRSKSLSDRLPGGMKRLHTEW